MAVVVVENWRVVEGWMLIRPKSRQMFCDNDMVRGFVGGLKACSENGMLMAERVLGQLLGQLQFSS